MKLPFTLSFLIATLLLHSTSIQAQNKVVVIPLNMTNHAKQLHNVITVSKSGGDFTDPLAAVASITDADETNPYLVVIGPGIYTLEKTLFMKPWISISGAGQGSTILSAALGDACGGGGATTYGPPIPAIKSAAGNSTNGGISILQNLTVQNTGSENCRRTTAIYNHSNSPVIQDVTVIASGGVESTTGVLNSSSAAIMKNMTITVNCSGIFCNGIINNTSQAVMSNIDITATGGVWTSAIENTGIASPTLTNITAKAVGGDKNAAIANDLYSSPILFNVVATATGGRESIGIGNDYFGPPGNIGSSPTMTNVIASASGGTVGNYGMKSNYNTSPTCRRCTLRGETGAFYATGDSINRVIQSSLLGGVIMEDNSILTCVNSDNGLDKKLDINCSEITP